MVKARKEGIITHFEERLDECSKKSQNLREAVEEEYQTFVEDIDVYELGDIANDHGYYNETDYNMLL